MNDIITKLDKFFNDWPYHKDSDLEMPGSPLTWKEFYALYKVYKRVKYNEHVKMVDKMFVLDDGRELDYRSKDHG